MFTISREAAALIDRAFLPRNPLKLRTAAPGVVDAVLAFRAELRATAAREAMGDDPMRSALGALLRVFEERELLKHLGDYDLATVHQAYLLLGKKP
jgi:hypothetical protein